MNVGVTVKFKILDLISEEDLDTFYKGDLGECVEEMIKSEGLFGMVEDEFKIIEVETY